MTVALHIHDLRKQYSGTTAVAGLSFDVEAGSLCALLGANGAGKSTTIACISTLLGFDSGVIEVLGDRVGAGPAATARIRGRIGVVFQTSVLDPLLSVRENLTVRARLYGLDAARTSARIFELADMTDLTGFLDRRYGTLSGGQKRRADIARALIHSPEILILDEPTAGLDPASRERIWEAIHTLRRATGMTVLLTTHYLAETELADDVIIIAGGALVERGSAADLRARLGASRLSITPRPDASALIAACAALPGTREGDRFDLRLPGSAVALDLLAAHHADILDFEFRHGTMDDVFLSVTGDTSKDPA
ncbi:multidrug/hemolysin transport system ATP-binding protein [Mycetocola sp. BIGb0189]|uniref:ABC transporter ATP-binding protein n=1 Tax=Mycetocola sp. BIGb0189 TaxID=2940604 RepID=UPI00216A8311|nr:ABC transporter ATP-binding protein [Mycetocola sp. BIGb0189]MCS4275054.1 multidrug/hemolysin transport system ATP-binding protein [Mycetocola sp. BIGb0189]